MTRKDYEAFAQGFAQGLQARKIAWAACETEAGKRDMGNQIVGYQDAINMVAAVLQAENARFNRERFMDACGIVQPWHGLGAEVNSIPEMVRR